MVIWRIDNGLGNQMFEYANARLCKAKGHDVRLDMNKVYDSSFSHYKYDDVRQNVIQNYNITLPEINVPEYRKYEYIKRDNKKNKLIFFLAGHGLWKYRFYEEKPYRYIRRPLCLQGHCYVRAWFQDENYFKHIRPILLQEFTPKKKIKISKDLRKAMENEESVSIHIRRGDYVKIRHALKPAYYNRAMEMMKRKYKNPLFLIFSEDLEWAKRNLANTDNCIYVNEDKKLQDYEELMIMSRCRSNIISNSTYSWWGAWLNRNPDKMVIAPKGPWLSKQTNIIPKDWVAI